MLFSLKNDILEPFVYYIFTCFSAIRVKLGSTEILPILAIILQYITFINTFLQIFYQYNNQAMS